VAIERALCPVLIGRDEQLSQLEDALLAAHRGEGQVVLLGGEAGMGKTRLASELQKRALKSGTTVMWGGCSEAELALPYLPFLEAIGNYLRNADLKAVREQLGHSRRELALLFPKLGGDLPPADTSDPFQSKLRLFEAVLDLLNLAAAEAGLLVVLEDLHWADASTRELLDYLTRQLRNTRIMVLGTYRRDELHRKHPLLAMVQGWRRAGVATIVGLEALGREEVADMVAAIFDDPTHDDTRDFLHARTEGNPFVLEEMLKAALDRGDIFRAQDGWHRKALTELKIPATVRDTILLRVERLNQEQAELLRVAAVLGPSFSYQMLMALSGADRNQVQAALHAFVQLQLMEEDPQRGGHYRFRHALTREAIYDDLIAPQREELHARAARALRELPGASAVDLAYHLLAAGLWEEAVPACLSAAEDAERRRGFREAAELYERALQHVSQPVERGRVLCRLGTAYNSAGASARGQRYLEQGIPLLDKGGQVGEVAHHRLTLGRCYWERSRPDLARVEYERARASLEPEGPSEDLANAYVRLAGLHTFEFESAEAAAAAQRAIVGADAAKAEAPRIWAYNFLGTAMAWSGDPAEGLKFLDRSYREAAERGLDSIAVNALHNAIVVEMLLFQARDALAHAKLSSALHARMGNSMPALVEAGWIHRSLGELGKACQMLEEALTLARQTERSTWVTWIERDLARCYAALGRSEEALRLLPKGPIEGERQDLLEGTTAKIRVLLDVGDVAAARQEASAAMEPFEWAPLSLRRALFDVAVEALLLAGDLQESEELAARTRTAPAGNGDPNQARMDGRLALARGDLSEANRQLSTAVQFLQRVGYRLEEARARRALAEVKARQGDRAGAEDELRTVLAYADEYGAVVEARAARRQLSELGLHAPEEAVAAPSEGTAARQPSERLVTALFVDVRGYTAATAKEAPQATAEKVQSLFRWARLEIERHHGVVDQYAGDAVLATFNVSGARLDHALHALQAAIAIRDKATYGGLPVGMGIAVGPAVVGQLAKDGNVTAVGETVNLASRLQAQAQAGEILLSEETFRRTSAWLEQQKLAAGKETLTLKGIAEPMPAHRLRAPVRAT
jgi:class 3 adenylate cyclase